MLLFTDMDPIGSQEEGILPLIKSPFIDKNKEYSPKHPYPQLQEIAGWSFMAVTAVQVAVNLILLVRALY